MPTQDYLNKANSLVRRICEEIDHLGFPVGSDMILPDLSGAQFETSKDPYSGEMTRQSKWIGADGARVGEIKIHGDGSFYGEFDVLRPHPRNSDWFVESIVVWGKGEMVKSEPRLIRALGD
jgi:hypothetical protein